MPLILAALVYGIMWIWRRGVAAVHESVVAEQTPVAEFAKLLDGGKIARVPGSAVFLTRAHDATPSVMYWHVKHNRSLHHDVLALTLTTMSIPRVAARDRISVKREGVHFWRAEARFGFMERPHIAAILENCKIKGVHLDLADVTYYVGHETIVPREDGRGLPRWIVAIFAAMGRNSARLSDSLQLPHDHVIEIGREIAI